ncbi:hypothetical protein HHK36_031335 [Tetracentron sinense]|uniref:B box-type domain-containing protein n=1 Tax=Tetracentron sinense TaxID=13715 RepID=A0A834Y9C1_TETSI|nr:hypothetical protein HHK36_031335 [Tetracentron sinense]
MKQQDPSWILSLLSEKFFNPCILHEYAKKNEKNIFCLDCCVTICPHCLNTHGSHRLIQVRRYVYQDVIRLDDMEKLFDCSFVQSYTTNSAKVVFLKQRPQTRPLKGSGRVCNNCERSLQEPYHFCSLACKVQYLAGYEGFISKCLYDCENLALSDFGYADIEELDDDQMTPNSVLDGGMITYHTSSGSSTNGDVECSTVGCTATTHNVTRKKRSRKVPAENVYYRNTPPPACKRKGIPLRSPLF